MVTKVDQYQIFRFFCWFMLNNGYLSSYTPSSNFVLHGTKEYMGVSADGRIQIIDWWHSGNGLLRTPSETNIYLNGNLVWNMRYEGHYNEEALPLLKMALRYAYRAYTFAGCRGESGIVLEDMVYRNSWSGTFAHFSAEEQIFQLPDIPLGEHKINGGFLVKIEQ